MAASSLGKDFQDQEGPVVHRHFQAALQVTLLAGAEALVEQ